VSQPNGAERARARDSAAQRTLAREHRSAIRILSTGGSGGILILLVGFELLFPYSQKSEYG
jgi:hypothetical protein